MVGILDPFESIHGLVYQMTMRVFGCEEVASDQGLLIKTLGWFGMMEGSAHTDSLAVIAPLLPTPGLTRRARRQRDGIKKADSMQQLLDWGDSASNISAVSPVLRGAFEASLADPRNEVFCERERM